MTWHVVYKHYLQSSPRFYYHYHAKSCDCIEQVSMRSLTRHIRKAILESGPGLPKSREVRIHFARNGMYSMTRFTDENRRSKNSWEIKGGFEKKKKRHHWWCRQSDGDIAGSDNFSNGRSKTHWTEKHTRRHNIIGARDQWRSTTFEKLKCQRNDISGENSWMNRQSSPSQEKPCWLTFAMI